MLPRPPLTLLRVAACLCALLFVLAGCYRKDVPPPPPSPSYYPAEDYASDDVAGYAAEMAPAPRAKRSPSRAALAAPAPPPPPGSPPKTPPRVERKIHYSGYAQLRVVSAEESTDALTALAKELGGFVESVSGLVVTLRVPVAQFDEAFEQVAQLGDLLDRSITARDVTEAFTAIDLRLATAKRTRDRLVELLARAEDEKEKLALIQQIQRVSEDIDRMESQLRTLDSLARLSRITVKLVPREAQAWQSPEDETAEMAWIRELTPFEPDLVSYGKRLSLPVPDGMVQLTPKSRFIAESPDGSRIWSGRLPNEPQGDSTFWTDALKSRLSEQFASSETESVGGYTLVRLTDRGDSPYSWWIAVRAEAGDRWIEVVEIYYPTPTELERFGPAVRASLKASGGAS